MSNYHQEHPASASGSWSTSTGNTSSSRPHHITADSTSTISGLQKGKNALPRYSVKPQALLQQQQHPSAASGPPQTMTTTVPPHHPVSIEEGEWKGTISRTITQDQSDETNMEMDLSPHKTSHSNSIQSMEFSSSPSTIGSASSMCTISQDNDNHTLEDPPWNSSSPTTTNQQPQRNPEDAASVQSTTSSTAQFSSPGDRYRVEDANGTAYFSAGVLESSSEARYDNQHLLETSNAISLSPTSPDLQNNSVGDIYDMTSLTRIHTDDTTSQEGGGDKYKLSFIEEEKDGAATTARTAALGTVHQDGMDNDETDSLTLDLPAPNNNNHEEVGDYVGDLEALEAEFTKDMKNVLGDIEETFERGTATARDLEDKDRTTGTDGSSLRLGSLPPLSIDTRLANSLSPEETPSSLPNQDIFVSKGTNGTPSSRSMPWSSSAPPAGGISLLRSNSHGEQSRGNNNRHTAARDQTVATSQAGDIHLLSAHVTDQHDPSPGWRISSIFDLESQNESVGTEESEHDQGEPKKTTGQEGSPTDANSSADVSFGQYLCSLVSGGQESEAGSTYRDEEGTTLSGISRLSQGSADTEDAEGQAQLLAKLLEPQTTTPQKSNIPRDTNDYSSPSDAIPRKYLPNSPKARIEALEEQLDGARRIMKEQKEYYEEQLAKYHEFTLPLNPHSPFDAVNLKKYSPDTQQRKLIERNQTAIKEIRFAEVTCVELSQQIKTLEEQVVSRDQEIQKLQQEKDEIKNTCVGPNTLSTQLEKANEDKLGLEQRLHAAYDKLEGMKTQHHADLETVQLSVANQKEKTIKELREQLNSVSSISDRQASALETQRQELQDIAAERKNLYDQIHRLNNDRNKPGGAGSERDAMNSRTQQLSSAVEEARRALQSTKEELADVSSERDLLSTKVKQMEDYKTKWSIVSNERNRLADYVKELSGELEERNHTLLLTQQERDGLGGKVEQLSSAIEEANGALLSTRKDRDVLRDKAKHLSGAVEEAKCALQSTQEELAEVSSERASLSSQMKEFEDCKEKLSITADERDRLSDKVREASRAVEEVNQALSSTQWALQEMTRERDALQSQTDKLSGAFENANHKLQLSQEELRDLVHETKQLESAVEEANRARVMAQQKTKDVTLEREMLKEKASQLCGEVEEAKRALFTSQQEAASVKNDLKLLQSESKKTMWSLKEAEQEVCEISELKDHESAKTVLLEQQLEEWKVQAETLQDELHKTKLALSKNNSLSKSSTSRDLLLEVKDLEDRWWRDETSFFARVERDMEKLSSYLVSVGTKANSLPKANAVDHAAGTTRVSPALLSQFLSSSSEPLSPQVIQALQLISTFVQQHLAVVDAKVAKITSEYTERLGGLQNSVDYIRSSIEFDSDGEDSESKTPGETKDSDVLDATFAAVTSIPDHRVERLEEGRSLDSAVEGGASSPQDDMVKSPARDTILDLSKIEAVSPFYSSDLTFSMDSDKEGRLAPPPDVQNKMRLKDVESHIFRDPLEADTAELCEIVSRFQEEFSQHRDRLRSFVSCQQATLLQRESEVASSQKDRVVCLTEEKNALSSRLSKAQQSILDLSEKIRKFTLDLGASERARERLKSENATLQKDMVDLEHRLIGNSKAVGDPWARDKLQLHNRTSSFSSRTNSFQERLEAASIDEHSSSDLTPEYQQTRVLKAEIARLQDALRDTEVAHGQLKESFVSSNDKLAAADELAEKHFRVAEELDSTKRRESQLREEVSRLRKETDEIPDLVASHRTEKESLERRLEQAKKDNGVLDEKLKKATTALMLQQKSKATEEELQGKEEKLRLEVEDALKQKAISDKHIKNLEEEQRKTDETMENLKRSYATCSNKLAEATERMATFDSLAAEKDDLEHQVERAAQEIDQLKEALQATTRSQDSEFQDKATLQGELAAIRKEREQLQNELNAKGYRLSTAETKINALEERLSEATASKESCLQEIKRLEDEGRAAHESHEELKSNFATISHKVVELEGLLSEATSSKEQDAKDIKRLEEELQSTREAYENLQLTFIACNEKLARTAERMEGDANEENESLEQRLSRATEKAVRDHEGMLEQVDSLQHELELTKNELDSVRRELEDTEDQLVNRLEETEESLKESREESLKLRSEVTDLTKAKENCLAETGGLREALYQAEMALEDLTLSYADCNNKLAEKTTEIEEFTKQFQREKFIAGKERDEFLNKLEELETAEEQLQQEVLTVKKERDEITERIRLSQEAEERLQLEVASVTKEKDEVASSLQTVQNELQETNEKLNAAQEREESLRTEISTFNSEREELISKANEANTKLQETLEKLSQAQSREDAKIEETKELMGRLEGAEAAAEENREAARSLEELVEERDAMRESIEATRQGLEAVSQQRDALSTDLQNVRDELAEKERRLDESLEEGQKAKEDLAETSRLNDSYDAEIENLKQRLDSITSELSEDLQTTQAKLMQALAEGQQLREHLERMSQEKDSAVAEVDFLRLNQQQLEDTMEKLKLSFVECNEKLASVMEDRSNKEELIEELRADGQSLQKELDDAEQRDSERIDTINQVKAEKEEALQSAKEELAKFASEVRACRENVAASLSQISEGQNEHVEAFSSSDSDAASEVKTLKAVVPSLCEKVAQFQRLEADLRSSLRNQTHNSEELTSQLRNALDEARAARQEAQQYYEESEDRNQLEAKLKETEYTLLELASKLADAENDIVSLQGEVKSKAAWENRCFKLRQYMRKLVLKCDQWSDSYSEQAKLIQLFNERHQKTTERANQLAKKYAQLNEELRARIMDPHDASSIYSVHDEIGSELNNLAEMQHVPFTLF